MLGIVGAGGLTLLEGAILVLFTGTFTWIAFSFWNAVEGFLLVALGRDPITLRRRGPGASGPPGGGDERPLSTRTAILIPARDEPLGMLMGGIWRMLRSLDATGHGGAFELHLLSDSGPEAGAREEEAWRALQGGYRGAVGLGYRRRERAEGRKAGNIREFCLRSVGRYEHVVVLDADSVMEGATLVEMVRFMEANPRAGILQTVPVPERQWTRFGRFLETGARLHARLLATGQSFWQGDAANYWGHNAILRLEPFVRHGALPVLPGTAPLGGEILSHDFVEAALLRRAGWGVWLLPHLRGSREGVPGNLPDFGRRDRRWAQGSLQHLRLLGTPGLHPLGRLHFVMGALAYLSSALWLLLLLLGCAYVFWPAASGGPALAPAALPGGPGAPALPLLAVTGVLLFMPKALGLGLAVVRARRSGRAGRTLLEGLREAAFSVLVAPVLMMLHVRAVAEIVAGRDVAWAAQPRDGRRIRWREAVASTGWISAAGAAWLAATLWWSPLYALWLAPILVGLLLAAPIVRWSSGGTRRPAPASVRPARPAVLAGSGAGAGQPAYARARGRLPGRPVG